MAPAPKVRRCAGLALAVMFAEEALDVLHGDRMQRTVGGGVQQLREMSTGTMEVSSAISPQRIMVSASAPMAICLTEKRRDSLYHQNRPISASTPSDHSRPIDNLPYPCCSR